MENQKQVELSRVEHAMEKQLYCADLFSVFAETVTINPGDARWVGAWWLGYLIAGTITLMSAIPFWFLPKSLPMPVEKHDTSCTPEQTRFIKDSPTMEHKFRPEEPANLHRMAKGKIIVEL